MQSETRVLQLVVRFGLTQLVHSEGKRERDIWQWHVQPCVTDETIGGLRILT